MQIFKILLLLSLFNFWKYYNIYMKTKLVVILLLNQNKREE